ncbi:hypothetical protein Tco_0539022, partial [Tanacetum coccineum]
KSSRQIQIQQRGPNRGRRRADQADSNRQESHKYGDEREQTAADRADRCITQNHINTKMNESRHQQTVDSDRQQIADSGSSRFKPRRQT